EKLSELEQMEAKLVDVQKSITAQREESDQQKEKLEEKENELQASVEEMELEDGELAALEEDILGEIQYTNALADARTSESSEEADDNGAYASRVDDSEQGESINVTKNEANDTAASASTDGESHGESNDVVHESD